jgi:hypothetical protein
MVYTEINSAIKGDNASLITNFSVDGRQTDAATGTAETSWQNSKASQYLGYYKSIPELKIAIDVKAMWVIGKGFTSNPLTTLKLGAIKGFGKDTFNSILENLLKQKYIYGDAFAEIIRDGDRLVNLKPLDPGTIKIIADSKGLIKRYEQNAKGKPAREFQPENIFHLTSNRVADEIHGVSIIESVENIILARNEAMTDYKKLLHRNIYPVRIWHLDTDIPSKIATFKAKVAAAKGEGEDIFIPKGAVETETVAIPENSSLNPMPWVQMQNKYFFQAVGVPEIIIGGSQELTQTAAQIAYLAWEQTVEQEQLNVEEQVLTQLNLEIDLEFPASLQNNLLSDNRKDGSQEQQLNQSSNLQPPAMREGVQ